MLSVQFRETLSVSDISFEVPIGDLIQMPVGDTVVLVVATESGGGLASFALQAGTTASGLAVQSYTPGSGGLSGVELVGFERAGDTYVAPFGAGVPAWTGYALDPVDGIGAQMSLRPEGSSTRPGPVVEMAGSGPDTYVFAKAANGVDITIYDLGADLIARPAGQFVDPDRDGDIAAMASTGTGLLLVASTGRNELVSYRIDPGGGLGVIDRLGSADGLGVAAPTALETVVVDGETYVVMAASGSSSLSVVRVAGDGTLSAVDHVIDTLDTRFGGVTQLATARFGDWQLVLAAGADDGLALFALLPGGQLLHLDSVADSAAATLDNVSALTAAVLGTQMQIFAASQSEAGLSQFDVDLSGLGGIIEGSGTGALLRGGALDDVLIAGNGADRLLGGAGQDMFVFRPGRAAADGRLGRVLDFDPAEDRLDLSTLPFLYDIAQVTVELTASGAILRFAEFWLELSGTALEAGDFTTANILNAQHMPLTSFYVPPPPPLPPPPPPPPPPDPSPGTGSGGSGGVDSDQVLTGTTGSDNMTGGSGNDTLNGLAGDDRIDGADGDDTISGGAGDDTLLGGAGDDLLRGGDGADILNGGAGNDTILGGDTSADLRDIIYGGDGNDTIDAGYGNDLVYGMDGDDIIAGGFGADELQGQNGNDVITGSALSDEVFGGAGDDFVNGGFGHDRINGGSGADKFYHLGIFDHGSDWVQDYSSAEGDVLLFGNSSASASNFQVNFANTENAAGERSGDDDVMEAFVIYKPTGQIIWALVDGAGQASINLQIAGSGELFDLLG